LCNQLSDKAISHLINGGTSLEDLDLTNTLISDGTLYTIVHRHKNLIRLVLNSCFSITASGLNTALAACERVVMLSLKEVNMNDRTFEFIADVPAVLPRLQIINVCQSLEFAARFSPKSVKLLQNARPHLTIISQEV